MKLSIDLDGVLAERSDGSSDARYWYEPELWPELVPVKGAIEGMHALRDDGHLLNIVTARKEHGHTLQWLDKYGFPYQRVYNTASKWNVPAHLYLDDSPLVLNGLYERGLVAVKFRYAYNIDAFAKHEVDDWPEFVKLIRSGIKGKYRRHPHKLRSVHR